MASRSCLTRHRSAWLAPASSTLLFYTRTKASADASNSGTVDAAASSSASTPPPRPPTFKEGTTFKAYDSNGHPVTFKSMIDQMMQHDVVLLGEFHDDPVAHRLEFEVLRLLESKCQQLGASAPHNKLPNTPQTTRSAQKSTTAGASTSSTTGHSTPSSTIPLSKARQLILSLEMFETDVQPVMNEYLHGSIRETDFTKDARAWPNYHPDYAPLVQFARARQLPVVCANAPRRLVSLAGRSGRGALASLPLASQALLAPLPYQQPSQQYVDKTERTMREAAREMEQVHMQQQQQQLQQQQQQQHDSPSAEPPAAATPAAAPLLQAGQPVPYAGKPAAPETAPTADAPQQTAAAAAAAPSCPYIGFNASTNFLDAQCLWDATMAHSIAKALASHQQQQQQQQPSSITAASPVEPQQHAPPPPPAAAPAAPLVVHVCGKFHCEERLGISEHLARYSPAARVLVLVFQPVGGGVERSAEQLQQQQLVGLGDYVVLTDASLPRSFLVEHPV